MERAAITDTQATIKPCRRPLRETESHVRLKHKLIQDIVSLRSKCFQSSYCAKVREETKKMLKGHSFFFFFALVPAFETNLVRKRLLRRLEHCTLLKDFRNKKKSTIQARSKNKMTGGAERVAHITPPPPTSVPR